jgi:predicted RNA-binding protein
MENWIFVINDNDEVLKRRVKEKKWPIFLNTQNRTKLKMGDRIVFYKAGKHGKKFIGKASISTELQKEGIDFSLGLSNVEIWEKPINITSLIDSLEFIKDKTNWGSHLQGGVRSISNSDYTAILSKI